MFFKNGQITRPKLVGDSIEVFEDGLNIGRYGPFELHSVYQPIFRVDDDEQYHLEAYEGLIRPFKDGEALSPRILFDTVIKPDHMFVECMCRALHLRNFPLITNGFENLFVNIDVAKYENRNEMEYNFLYFLRKLTQYGLSTSRIVFEIVESKPNDRRMLEWTRDMAKDHHVKIAIDDFGSDHSDMDRFLLMRPQIVKIDSNLFQRSMSCFELRKLLATTISTFQMQNAEVLIEGIENKMHLEMALSTGANLLQGFGMERPMAIGDHELHNKTAVKQGHAL